MTPERLKRLTVGSTVRVPVVGGRKRTYLNLDNAASTPPFTQVLREVNQFSRWYSNVHRGTGFKSRLSSWAYEAARDTVRRFIGADSSDTVLFPRGTTQAINHVAARLPLGERQLVLVSSMEHHSNDLPWRKVAEVIHIGLHEDGTIDQSHLQQLLRRHGKKVALVAVSGASNVTGVINPIHRFAGWAHEIGALLLVDGAQLAPHRPMHMRSADDPEHLDFVAFSAHKMYAPFGAGVLAGPRSFFERGQPYEVGGGTVSSVSSSRVTWTDLPDREEAGTPCVIGAIALAAAIKVYQEIGWETIARHEAALTAQTLRRLSQVPGLTLYGDTSPDSSTSRLGVISFNLDNVPHSLVSAILSHEWGIGTRSGCFCAQMLIRHLLGIDDQAARDIERRVAAGDRGDVPGAVRVSLGLYNTSQEIETLSRAMNAIAAGQIRGQYCLDRSSGEYLPTLVSDDFSSYLGS